MPALEKFRAEGATGVVTASTGNHGAATAWAARLLGLEPFVYAPENASKAKLDRLRELGAVVRLIGSDVDEAKDVARAYADERGLPLFEDGAEPAQYDGYTAIGANCSNSSTSRLPPWSCRSGTAPCSATSDARS